MSFYQVAWRITDKVTYHKDTISTYCRNPMADTGAKGDNKGGKQRTAFYLTAGQVEKVRLLAVEKNESQSKIVGDLIDKAPEPSFKRIVPD